MNDVYKSARSLEDFAPWLERIEGFPAAELKKVADEVPCEWYGERAEMEFLLQRLIERRRIIRELIEAFRASTRRPFPRWDHESTESCETNNGSVISASDQMQ